MIQIVVSLKILIISNILFLDIRKDTFSGDIKMKDFLELAIEAGFSPQGARALMGEVDRTVEHYCTKLMDQISKEIAEVDSPPPRKALIVIPPPGMTSEEFHEKIATGILTIRVDSSNEDYERAMRGIG